MHDDPDSEAVAELFRDSSPPSLCKEGQEFARTGRLEFALMYFMRAIDIDPDYSLAGCDYGHCLYQLERFEDAKDALRKAT
jgi:tetratricopeptide (TPR) repeat protein